MRCGGGKLDAGLALGISKCLALLAGPAAPTDAVPPWGGSRWLLDPGRMGPTSLNPLLG